MWVAGQPEEGGTLGPVEARTREKLDRALVAGLMLEVVLDEAGLPASRRARQQAVKNRLQDRLVRRLAGLVSLDRFRCLAQNLDGWFDYYYPLLVAEDRLEPAQPQAVQYGGREPQAGYTVQEPRVSWLGSQSAPETAPPVHQACHEKLLDRWLEAAKTEMPHRSHRKLTPSKLKTFLHHSGGRWFRLRDFERFVQMDRKTAWDYLQQFLQAGLLCHNRKQSAAVRYCLAPAFLKVEADALRLAISLSLSSHPEEFAEQISDFLIATGGEPFPRREWDQHFPAPAGQSCLEELTARDIVVWHQLPTGSGFLKLHHRWLQPESQEDCSADQAGSTAGAGPPTPRRL